MKFIRLKWRIGSLTAGKVLRVPTEIREKTANDLLESGFAIQVRKAEWNAQLPRERKREALKGI